jgi:hypothetical protein
MSDAGARKITKCIISDALNDFSVRSAGKSAKKDRRDLAYMWGVGLYRIRLIGLPKIPRKGNFYFCLYYN